MGLTQKIDRAYSETRRILRLTRKPKRSEFNETAKITGLGMVMLGVVGFAIFFIALMIRGG